MKTIKVTLVFLALAVLFLFTSQSALADSEVARLEGFLAPYVVKDAPGTKLFGTLTIYYEQTGSYCTPPGGTEPDPNNPVTNMYFFIRLNKLLGREPYSFSGKREEICLQSFDEQYFNVLSPFITTNVLPNVLTKKPKSAFQLKSVSNFVQDDQLYSCCPCPFFGMMDFEFAVQE